MKRITEAGGRLAVAEGAEGTGLMEITLITPGWGSSGYYSAEMLQKAGESLVFPEGTQMHIDHLTRGDNPAGSLKTLAAALTEDATWDPDYVDENTGNRGRLKASALVGSEYRTKLSEFAKYIGASISAAADIQIGEAEGRRGPIVKELFADPLNRVDFVTVAGRGGKIEAVLEAFTTRAAEVTANDTRDALSVAVRAAFSGDEMWSYLLDYDDSTVWFQVESPGDFKTYASPYTMGEDAAELTGEPVEVRRTTVYKPIAAPQESASTDSPPDPAGVTEEKGSEMTTVTIEESVHADLLAQSSRATALEAEVTAATGRATVAEAALTRANDTAAAAIVASALEAAGFTAPKLAARLSTGYPVAEDGVLDTEALQAEVAESIAELQSASGAGSVRGMGAPVAESAAPAKTDKDIVSVLEGKA